MGSSIPGLASLPPPRPPSPRTVVIANRTCWLQPQRLQSAAPRRAHANNSALEAPRCGRCKLVNGRPCPPHSSHLSFAASPSGETRRISSVTPPHPSSPQKENHPLLRSNAVVSSTCHTWNKTTLCLFASSRRFQRPRDDGADAAGLGVKREGFAYFLFFREWNSSSELLLSSSLCLQPITSLFSSCSVWFCCCCCFFFYLSL